MNIAIIGTGNIGGNLGIAWTKRGHNIMFGVRNPNSDKTRAALAKTNAQVGTLAEAAAFGEVIVLAVPWPAVGETIAAMGNLDGKILIDPINAFVAPSVQHGSAAQDIAALAPGARVVKAFNTLGAEGLLDPLFSGIPVTTFVCADDAEARARVLSLAAEIGLDTKDAGPLANAALVEAVGKLWVYMMRNGSITRDTAFTLTPR